MKRIAIAQININYADFESNVARSMDLIHRAVINSCDMVILPELWSSGFKLEKCSTFAKQNKKLLDQLQDISSSNQIEITGSYITESNASFHNQFICVKPDSPLVTYNKINLFPGLDESKFLKGGNEICVFSTSLGKVGASICFDLRFHWIYESERKKGADIFIIPAHWPAERIHHWDVLLRSRAIENVAFVIGVNSVGVSGRTLFGGHSTVVSPDGQTIYQCDDKTEDLFIVDIEPEQIQLTRDKYKLLQK